MGRLVTNKLPTYSLKPSYFPFFLKKKKFRIYEAKFLEYGLVDIFRHAFHIISFSFVLCIPKSSTFKIGNELFL